MSDHPISTTYLDVQTAKVSAVLPAGGAWDVPLELACPGFSTMILFMKYTRNGPGGSFNLKVEVSRASTGAVWHQIALYEKLSPLVAGADSESRIQREYLTYVATGANPELIEQAVNLFGGIERVRVTCAELGAQATPGTLEVLANFA